MGVDVEDVFVSVVCAGLFADDEGAVDGGVVFGVVVGDVLWGDAEVDVEIDCADAGVAVAVDVDLGVDFGFECGEFVGRRRVLVDGCFVFTGWVVWLGWAFAV